MKLPRCTHTDIPRLWCACTHCAQGFTMTPEEQRQRELWLDRAGEPPSLPTPPRGRRVGTPPSRTHGPALPPVPEPANPPADTLDMLARLPDMAADALITWDHPNPGGQAPRTRKARPGSKAPTRLDTLDALRTDPPTGSLRHRTGADADERAADLAAQVEGDRLLFALDQCARAVHEETGIPLPPPTWASLCGWLITHGLWQHDPFLSDWVSTEVAAIHTQLARIVRIAPEPKYRCPTCGWPMRLQPGDYFLCDGGEHQHPGPLALEIQWRRRPPSDTRAIIAMFAAELGHTLTEPQIWQWHKRRKLTPARSEGRKLYWLPWDVMRCVQPEVVEALDAPGRTG